jgi:BirA family biotin operon repressor/biotin-[acetyl-CoA-carboxylase] ligase
VSSEFSDLDRPPLREKDLERSLLRRGDTWSALRVVTDIGSTNAELVRAARAGAASGSVLVAEHQYAGRGRLDRSWTAPVRTGLTFSVLLRPQAVPVASWGWFPLLAGVAVARATAEVADLEARLKWPNDVLVGDRKVAGILAERVDDALVLGVGLNVSSRADELPVEGATSLHLEGASSIDRAPVLLALLRELADRYEAFEATGGDPVASGVHPAYLQLCATLGRQVRVTLPGGTEVAGPAIDVDEAGRLVVATDSGEVRVGAGDVVHVR